MPTLEELVALPEGELRAKFETAAENVRKLPPRAGVSNDQKLKVYGLFKQANTGDNQEAAPWAIQLEKKAKWDAWTLNKGKTKQQAMAEYVMEIESQMGN